MTDNTQPEALAALIERFRGLHIDHEPDGWPAVRTREITALLDRIAELETQLEAIGAGGVTGPLIGQPQAMPDLSQLTERGAKAWAGVDAQGLREGGADMSKERDDLTAFYAWLHTYESEVGALDDGSARVGFIAGRASLQPPGFTAADMATASAQGFRDGRASLPLPGAQEPVAPHGWLYDWTHSSATGRPDETYTGFTKDEQHARKHDNCTPVYTAPQPALSAGWRDISTAPKDGTELLLWREDCGRFIGSYTSADGFPLTQDEIDAMDEETLFTKDWFTQWPDARRLDGSEAPTKWQPLPVEPSMDGESNG